MIRRTGGVRGKAIFRIDEKDCPIGIDPDDMHPLICSSLYDKTSTRSAALKIIAHHIQAT